MDSLWSCLYKNSLVQFWQSVVVNTQEMHIVGIRVLMNVCPTSSDLNLPLSVSHWLNNYYTVAYQVRLIYRFLNTINQLTTELKI